MDEVSGVDADLPGQSSILELGRAEASPASPPSAISLSGLRAGATIFPSATRCSASRAVTKFEGSGASGRSAESGGMFLRPAIAPAVTRRGACNETGSRRTPAPDARARLHESADRLRDRVCRPVPARPVPRLRLPSVVLEIVAGIVVGPSLLGWVEVDETVAVVALVGLTFVLFLAGLEIELDKLRGPLLRLTGLGFALSFALALVVALALKAGGLVETAAAGGDHPQRDLARSARAGAQGRGRDLVVVRAAGHRGRLDRRLRRDHPAVDLLLRRGRDRVDAAPARLPRGAVPRRLHGGTPRASARCASATTCCGFRTRPPRSGSAARSCCSSGSPRPRDARPGGDPRRVHGRRDPLARRPGPIDDPPRVPPRSSNRSASASSSRSSSSRAACGSTSMRCSPTSNLLMVPIFLAALLAAAACRRCCTAARWTAAQLGRRPHAGDVAAVHRRRDRDRRRPRPDRRGRECRSGRGRPAVGDPLPARRRVDAAPRVDPRPHAEAQAPPRSRNRNSRCNTPRCRQGEGQPVGRDRRRRGLPGPVRAGPGVRLSRPRRGRRVASSPAGLRPVQIRSEAAPWRTSTSSPSITRAPRSRAEETSAVSWTRKRGPPRLVLRRLNRQRSGAPLGRRTSGHARGLPEAERVRSGAGRTPPDSR